MDAKSGICFYPDDVTRSNPVSTVNSIFKMAAEGNIAILFLYFLTYFQKYQVCAVKHTAYEHCIFQSCQTAHALFHLVP